MKRVFFLLFCGLIFAALGTARAQSDATISPRSAEVIMPPNGMNISVGRNPVLWQDKRSQIIIDNNGLSDKLLAPNAKEIRQQTVMQKDRMRSLTTTNEPIDLGDGIFLLSDDADPMSSLLEVRLNDKQWTSLLSTSQELVNISNLIYSKFNDDFDFIFFVLNTPFDADLINQLGFYGVNISVRNDVRGIGMPVYNNTGYWGSDGKLKSAMFYPYYDAILTGPALHELLHNWAADILSTYAPDNALYNPHWGVSNAGGQLGGFKYVRVVEENCDGVLGKTLYQASFSSDETNPDGSFKFPGFGVDANGGNGLPYSDIELYLMGMKSAQELRDSGFTLDIYSGNDYNYDGKFSFGNGYFYSTTKTSYTIDDIIALNGVRDPDASISQKQFKVLTVAITPETASENYSEEIIRNVGWFAGKMDDATHPGLYNFRQATYNAGLLIVNEVKNSFKLNPLLTLNNIDLSVGTLSPVFNPYVFDYTVQVDGSVETIDITGTTDNPNVEITGNVTGLPLKLDDYTDVTITVTDDNGNSKIYTITVIRGKLPPVSFTWDIYNAGQEAHFYPGVVAGKLCTIDWGDGSPKETITGNGGFSVFAIPRRSHTYNTSGSYQVTIQGVDDTDCPVIALHQNVFEQEQNYYRITQIDLRTAHQLVAVDVRHTENTELDVSRNKQLTNLAWHRGKLTNLDVSKNKLSLLSCSGSPLSFLDVSKNTKLSELRCPGNLLTTLDVSKNTNLSFLDCSNNQIADLDLSSHKALTYLYCHVNQLTHLDVSNATALTYLYCSTNQLSNLDVSNCTALTTLYCDGDGGPLTELNVSNCTALTHLQCSSNQLTHLNISNTTALKQLQCQGNQLSNLDVSQSTNLSVLICDLNQLTHLDLSNNMALTQLSCSNNQLAELDVSNNTALTQLSCSNNQLTHLNVSNATALTQLNCSWNQLTHLDVSNGTVLTALYCQQNALPLINLYALAQQINNTTNTMLSWQQLPDSTVLINTPIVIDTVFYGVNTVFDVNRMSTTDYSLNNGEITFHIPIDYLVTIRNPAILDGMVVQRFTVLHPPATGVTLDKSELTLTVGQWEYLMATVTPTDANQAVTWSSSNTIATVDQTGMVTAISSGTAIITVSTEDGNFTATCEVTVLSDVNAMKNLNINPSIYPNPFADEVHITGAESGTLQIINALGITVHAQTITGNGETLPLGHLPAGMYFFRLEKDGNVKTVKVVKK